MNNITKLSSNSQKYYKKFSDNINNLQKNILELNNENNNNLKLLNFIKNNSNFINNNCDSILDFTTSPKIETIAKKIKNNNLEKDINELSEKIKKDNYLDIDLKINLQELNSLIDMLKNVKPTNNLTKHFITCNFKIYKHLYNIYKSFLKSEMQAELKDYINAINITHSYILKEIRKIYRIMK